MNMVEKEKDLIGFAHKVISFRMNAIKACKAKGIDAPTDEQISDYINNYGLHFEDFMADFTEHEGIFRCLRTPLEEFKDEIKKISWGTPPTEEEILAFFNKNGNNIGLFCNQHAISKMKPLERKKFFNLYLFFDVCFQQIIVNVGIFIVFVCAIIVEGFVSEFTYKLSVLCHVKSTIELCNLIT